MKSYLLFIVLVAQLIVNAVLTVKLQQRVVDPSTAPLSVCSQQDTVTFPIATTAPDIRQQVDQSLAQLIRSEEFRSILGKILEESRNTQQVARDASRWTDIVRDDSQRDDGAYPETETIYQRTQITISDAVAAGVWTADDSAILSQSLAQLPAGQQVELMKAFVGAVNRQELQLDGQFFPF